MANVCPKCNTVNRDGAAFCGGCGGRLGVSTAGTPVSYPAAGPAPALQPAPPGPPISYQPAGAPAAGPVYPLPMMPPPAQPPQATPPAPVYPIPMMPPPAQAPQAAAAAGHAARAAARKSWQVGKQGMGLLTRLVTGGGQAAYTELARPVPVLTGQVVSPPVAAPLPARPQLGAVVFVACLLLAWLILLIEEPLILAGVLVAAWIVLLAVSRVGVRRPYFSRQSLYWVARLFGNKTKGQVTWLRFVVRDEATNQPVDVVVLGHSDGGPPVQGQRVQVWGIPEAARNEVRAWQVAVVDQAGRAVQLFVADRLVPLSVALFLPLVVVTLGAVVMALIRLLSA